MPKFLYCLECHEGIELKLEEIKECKCKNVKGRYINSQKAEICARNPKNAFFIGIGCCKHLIYDEIVDRSPALIDEVEREIESKGISLKRQVPPKNFSMKDFNRDEFVRKLLRNYIVFIPFCKPEKLGSEELRSAIKETEEWKRFDRLRNEFLKIKSREAWEKWEKSHLVETCEKNWDGLLCRKGYSIGTVVSLEKDKWPEEWKERWEYNQSICETR